ncbi:MAG TPA: gluconeogenesis factor YvcK family protein [Blastocatellia bacterium]|nr:gluconeogenesis factor YvcK family protein [Blastocatellia bacterium]
MSAQTNNSTLRIVAIGGGTGLSTLLTGLKPYLCAGQRASDREEKSAVLTVDDSAPEPKAVSLTAIVTVTDDGKSSGRLREEFGILPPGDIRSCLIALARDDRIVTRLFRHRFRSDGPLDGHSLGNLVIVALTQMSGDFLTAIEQTSALLGCAARVLPSTLSSVDLVAEVGGQMVKGQRAIKSLSEARHLPIRNLTITPATACALPEAIDAILEADVITLGPGSLFTSVIPNLLVDGIAEAISRSRAVKIYICNVMTEADETDGFTAEDHVAELLSHGRGMKLDYALFNSAPISAEMRERYAAEKAVALAPPQNEYSASGEVRFIALPLASEARAVRHDPDKLSRAVFELLHL